jgi:site-specific recombinase XerD
MADLSPPAPLRAVHGGWQIPPNTGKRYPAEVLTPDEIRALIRACSNRAPTGIRNAALIVVMYRGGLRISECLALKPKDVDATQGTLHVMNGKGGRARVVGLDPEAIAVLERWLDRRSELGLNGRQPIFSTLKGQPMAASNVRHTLVYLAKRAGVERRIHPHIFRHSHAAELAAEGIPMNVIQQQLGHSSLATTSRYLQHVHPLQVVEAMQSRPTWGAPN